MGILRGSPGIAISAQGGRVMVMVRVSVRVMVRVMVGVRVRGAQV